MSLDRTPAADLIQGTVAAWLEALTVNRNWVEEQDAKRVRQAFITLAQTRRTWPVPADFFDALPRYHESVKALPGKPADPELVKRVMTELADFLRVPS